MLDYVEFSWIRYFRGLEPAIGQMVHVISRKLILKAAEELHHYSLSQEAKSID